MDEGAYAQAARAYRDALLDEPEAVELWLGLGRAQMAAGQSAAARRAFIEAQDRSPADPAIPILIGHTHELERHYDLALAEYRRALTLAPDQARPHRVLGTRLLRWDRAAEAVAPLARAVQLDPTHAETRNALGLAQHRSGDLRAAEATFRAGIAAHPRHLGLRLGLAAMLVNAGAYGEALATYDGVVALAPEFAPAHVGRALLLHELGRRHEALEAFELAVRVADDPRPYAERLARYRREHAPEP
jgi:tetratricopeptide (TPR) repeat protein